MKEIVIPPSADRPDDGFERFVDALWADMISSLCPRVEKQVEGRVIDENEDREEKE